jgi:hypothetical protein
MTRLPAILRCALVALLPLAAACDDEGVADLGAPLDLAVPDLPLTLPDLVGCVPGTFLGFPGTSDFERRFDCTPCGCIVDPLRTAASSAVWARTLISSTIEDGSSGLHVEANGAAGPAFASLASLNPVGAFFLDGDFDLRVDYHGADLAPGGKIALRVDVLSGLFWEIARTEAADGAMGYTAQLGGVAGSSPTNVTSGTLRLVRQGFTIEAYADGVLVASTTAGAAARAAVYLSVGVLGCDAFDGGTSSTDGGGGLCSLSAVLSDLRLQTGVLVDRR